jgi:hypothetical protein
MLGGDLKMGIGFEERAAVTTQDKSSDARAMVSWTGRFE